MTEYCFVLDLNNNKLDPTTIQNGWRLIRKNKARLIDRFPMCIKLNKEIEETKSEFNIGIDDGSKYVGIGIIQINKYKLKPIFKGTIEQRWDVKNLMDIRKYQRRYRRNHKRYRKERFNNRASSKRNNRIAPSILQKKQAIIRVVNRLNKYCKISNIYLEDVMIDIRVLNEEKKLYSWQYQKSNRLDENIRKATILRDGNKCMECGKTNIMLEVHHITPRRLKGSNSLSNLISLCLSCHQKTKDKEMDFADKYYSKIKGKNIRNDYAQHVMIGKNWLRKNLNNIANLILTTGGDTANKRIDYSIKKSHSNDALIIALINHDKIDITDWLIRPMRRQSKAITSEMLNFKMRDLVEYIKKDGTIIKGWISSLQTRQQSKSLMYRCSIQYTNGCYKGANLNKVKHIWSFNKQYYIK